MLWPWTCDHYRQSDHERENRGIANYRARMQNTNLTLRKVSMFDASIENFARIIVKYSTRVRPEERVAIRVFPLSTTATPLINAVAKEVLKAGG
jgi:hypothetical protein